MKNFMKTIINAIKHWTNSRINSLSDEFNNRINTSKADWNQNDLNADNYVKNRTHWEEDNITTLVPKTEVTIGSQLFVERAISIKLVLGQIYRVIWNDKEYECICYDNNGAAVIGNDSCWGGESGNGEPFLVSNYSNLTAINAYEQGTYTISIYTGEKVIHKLDPKYLPDNIGVQVDWEEEDETSKSFIKNKPFGKGKIFLINDIIEINQDGYYEFDRVIDIDPNLNYLCTINGANYLTNTYYDDTDYCYVMWLTDEDGNGAGYVYDNIIYLDVNVFDPSQSYDIAIYTEGIQKIDTKFLPDETDPTVPDWAKQPNKPNYTVDEIEGAARQSDLNKMKSGIVLLDTISGIPYIIQMQNGNLVSSINASIDDFAYTVNNDGTYAITDWNQTYLGEPSTEMILPEDSKIIL